MQGVRGGTDTKQAVIVADSRDTAVEVQNQLNSKKLSTVCLGQSSTVPSDWNAVVGTAIQLADALAKKSIKLSGGKIVVVVLCADEIICCGCKEHVQDILKAVCPYSRSTLITSRNGLTSEVRSFKNHHKTVEIDKRPEDALSSPDTIVHAWINYHVQIMKVDTLFDILSLNKQSKAVLICNTRQNVETLADQLAKRRQRVSTLHTDLNCQERETNYKAFENQKTHYLVTTDQAIRGLKLSSCDWIINYDLPSTYEKYVQRYVLNCMHTFFGGQLLTNTISCGRFLHQAWPDPETERVRYCRGKHGR